VSCECCGGAGCEYCGYAGASYGQRGGIGRFALALCFILAILAAIAA